MAIEFTREEKEAIAGKIQLYFREELNQEIGGFDAQFLLDFFTEEIGPIFYNKGLNHGLAIFEDQLASVADVVYENEMPTSLRGVK